MLNVLTSNELANWQQVEIEVEPGNVVSNESAMNIQSPCKDQNPPNEDADFQKLKEKLHAASQKYNTDSKLIIRFLQPLQITVSKECSRWITECSHSPQVWKELYY